MPFRLECAVSIDGCELACCSNGEMLLLQAKDVSTSLHFYVGHHRDPARQEPIKLPVVVPWSVFLGPGGQLDEAESWLSGASHTDLISQLVVGSRDSLHVFKNGVMAIFEPRSQDENWALLHVLCALAKALPTEEVRMKPGEEIIDGMSVDLSALPEDLRPLIPYLREWSINDDAECTEKQRAASTEELQALFDAVWPKMAAINAYLDEADKVTPYPDEAMLLGRLAECGSELQFELRRRTGADPTQT